MTSAPWSLATEATVMASLLTSKPTESVLDWCMADLRVCSGVDLRRLGLEASSPAVDPEVSLPLASHYV